MQPSETHQPASHQPALRRALGPWSTVAIIMGTVIGSGIFLVPTDMVKAVGSPGTVFAVWVFGGVLSLFGALTYAELSAALPEAGGEYAYLTAAYGPFWGFLYAWTQTWVAKSASIAALATAFYTYLADFLPGLQAPLYVVPWPIGPGGGPLEIRYGQLLAICLILLLSAVNYRGVRVGGHVQVGVTALKVLLIGGVIAVGLLSRQASLANLHTSTDAHTRWRCRILCRVGRGALGLRRMEQRRDARFRGRKSATNVSPGADCGRHGDYRRVSAHQSRVFFGVERRRSRRQRPRRRGHDAAHCRPAWRCCSQRGRHDFDFRGAEWLDFIGIEGSLCHGSGRIFLSAYRAWSIPYSELLPPVFCCWEYGLLYLF